MRRTLACLILLGLWAPMAEAKPDAWPYLVRASHRIKEGRRCLENARFVTVAQHRRKHAGDAARWFEEATSEAAMGLQIADKTLKDGLFDAWNEAKKLEAEANKIAAAAAKKKKKAKKPAKKARRDDEDPPQASGQMGIVACSRINARRRAIGAPPLCRRGLTRR